MIYSKIVGTGSALPERIMHNSELENIVDTNDVWIRTRTGISQRHIASPNESSAQLGSVAAQRAMQAASIKADSIDLIIVATTTPDQVFPSTACLLQRQIGNHGSPAFDVQAVCTGFLYALDIADKYIRCGQAKIALVVGAETMSKIIDWDDRRTCVLFGDGAGAVLLSADNSPGIYSSHLHADGAYADLLKVSPKPPDGIPTIEMQGNEVFKLAVKTLVSMVDETLDANGMSCQDIDWLVPHQANIRIINAIARKLSLPMEKVVVTIAEHGNTSAASIPLALDCAVRDGRIQPGNLLLCEAIGGGFTWGSALLRY